MTQSLSSQAHDRVMLVGRYINTGFSFDTCLLTPYSYTKRYDKRMSDSVSRGPSYV